MTGRGLQEGGGLNLRLESGDPGETDMTVPTSLLIAAGRPVPPPHSLPTAHSTTPPDSAPDPNRRTEGGEGGREG